MIMTDQIDKNLKKIREADQQKIKGLTRIIGAVLLVLSLLMAAVFMYVFYVSPKKIIDIIVVSVAIASSSALFFMGLIRVFG